MIHHKTMNNHIHHTIDHIDLISPNQIIQKSRRSRYNLLYSQWEDYLNSLIKYKKDPLSNITIPKKPKKKKQHIVETMSNIKL